MPADTDYRRVLSAYPADCRGGQIEFLSGAGGFSGALFWQIASKRGPLCLRRWPRDHPTVQRLQFIQAVLWHVDQEGFHRLPLPLECSTRAGYVCQGGHLWELAPWLAGKADYRAAPSPARLTAALAALAEFHQAASSFPVAESRLSCSPGIAQRLARLDACTPAELTRLKAHVETVRSSWPALYDPACKLLELFGRATAVVRRTLVEAVRLQVPGQPCIRDIWCDHVLFDGQAVSGIIDFGAMRVDNVAADVARLLGSLAGDDPQGWQTGLAAYQRIRPLSVAEALLVTAFDRANVLLSGLNWVEWTCVEKRTFENPSKVVDRLDEFLGRLARLAAGNG